MIIDDRRSVPMAQCDSDSGSVMLITRRVAVRARVRVAVRATVRVEVRGRVEVEIRVEIRGRFEVKVRVLLGQGGACGWNQG